MKVFVSLGAVHSAPVGLIVVPDLCGRTPLVVNCKAVFFILICETNSIPVFLQIMVSRQKNIFKKNGPWNVKNYIIYIWSETQLLELQY